MRVLAVAISSFFLAAPALAQPSGNASGSSGSDAATSNSASTAPEEDPDRRICRRVDPNTGSRVPYRTVCLTERQWRNYRTN